MLSDRGVTLTSSGPTLVEDISVCVAVRPARPHPADVAQSRRFVAVLRREYADLRAQLASVEIGMPERHSDEWVDQVRGQLAEVRRLLRALDSRFAADGSSSRDADESSSRGAA